MGEPGPVRSSPILIWATLSLIAAAGVASPMSQLLAQMPCDSKCPATLKKSLDDYLKGPASVFIGDINDAEVSTDGPVSWDRPKCKAGEKPEQCEPHRHRGNCGNNCLRDLTTYKWKRPAQSDAAEMVLGANPEIKRIHPDVLPQFGIVLARIDYRGGPGDAFYHIDDVRKRLWWIVGYPDERRRVFYLVAEEAFDQQGKAVDGLARWRLIAIRDNNLELIREGHWYGCPIPHKSTGKDNIGFLSCAKQQKISEYSEDPRVQATLGVTNASDAFDRLLRGSKPRSEKSILSTLQSKGVFGNVGPEIAHEVRRKLLDAYEEGLDGPFWFRCAIGCCTAG